MIDIFNHKALSIFKIFPKETVSGYELRNESEWTSSRLLINSSKGFSESGPFL